MLTGKINRLIKMFFMIIVIVVSDQITKIMVHQKFYLGESIPIIPDFFHLTYIRNTGAAFGMLAQAEEFIRIGLFLALPVIACAWLLYLIWQTRKENFLHCFIYSLILAGAIGNLIDRFRLGYVIDFLDFFIKEHHFPAFNIADSAISIAATILIIDFVFLSKKKSNNATNTI